MDLVLTRGGQNAKNLADVICSSTWSHIPISLGVVRPLLKGKRRKEATAHDGWFTAQHPLAARYSDYGTFSPTEREKERGIR